MVCGNLSLNTKYIGSKTRKIYCSKECMWLAGYARNLLAGLLMLASTFVICVLIFIGTLNRGAGIAFAILTPAFAIGSSFGFYFIIISLKGRKLARERDLESASSIIACVFCNQEYSKRVYGSPTTCQNCGEESPFCDVCYQYIYAGKPVYQLQNCGHIFHKTHLLDHLGVFETCPKCKQKIVSIDLKIKKNLCGDGI
jgi:hypothetical protein